MMMASATAPMRALNPKFTTMAVYTNSPTKIEGTPVMTSAKKRMSLASQLPLPYSTR